MMPSAIPSAIEKLKGIIIAVITRGTDSEKSFHCSNPPSDLISNTPTNTSAGAVAYGGIAITNGATNRVARKRIPTTTPVSPVRPPTEIPVVLSMYDVVVEVPSRAPATVALLSASIARPSLGISPPSVSRPP